jgi:hypothetical protein
LLASFTPSLSALLLFHFVHILPQISKSPLAVISRLHLPLSHSTLVWDVKIRVASSSYFHLAAAVAAAVGE